jgi:hypothetical protein
LIQFIVQHPVVILYLAAGWFLAAIISAMPPLPEGQTNFFIRWAYNVAQIVGASLDKVGHVAQQSTAYKQIENTLKTQDPSGLIKTETAKTTVQSAQPVNTGVTQ